MPIIENNQDLSLRETVYLRLRKRILNGELKPGERLMEIHLAKKLDVSRTPVREAIRMLEEDGLVVIVPKSGARVAEISEQELKDALEVRLSLDALSVELACERISKEDKEKLKAAFVEFEEAVKTGSCVKVAEADVRFHDVIIEASGNRKLQEMLHTLADQLYRYRYEYIKGDGDFDSLVKEHRDLMEAVLAGDKKRARKATVEHISHQEETVLTMLKSGEKK